MAEGKGGGKAGRRPGPAGEDRGDRVLPRRPGRGAERVGGGVRVSAARSARAESALSLFVGAV